MRDASSRGCARVPGLAASPRRRRAVRFPAAFTLKSLIMPGQVIAAHASIEDKCESCHESDDTKKQAELCYVCHKEIRADHVSKSGLHGRDRRRG